MKTVLKIFAESKNELLQIVQNLAANAALGSGWSIATVIKYGL